MANDDHAPSARVRWARLRFQIIGPLLAAPPTTASSRRASTARRARRGGTRPPARRIRFSFKTIERWWYTARGAERPARRARAQGARARRHAPELSAPRSPRRSRASTATTRAGASSSTTTTSSRSRARTRASGPCPSYATVCRFMKEQGLLRARKRRHREHPDGEPFAPRETRSYEVTHVHGLWHLDFHEGSRPVLTADGRVAKAPAPRRPRRPLAPLLPPAVVPRRDRRGARPRPLAGVPEARPAARAAHRQRRRRCSPPRPSKASSASASSTTRRCRTPPSKTESRSPSGDRSKAASCPCSKASPSSRSTCSTPRRRPGSSRSTSARITPRSSETPLERYLRGPQRRSRQPELRGAPARVPHGGHAQTAPQRRHRHRRGRALRGPLRLPHAPAAPAPRRTLGPLQHRSGRPALGRPPRHAPAARQGTNAERVRRVVAPAPPPTSPRDPSASRRTCARSWPTTPPRACRPPTCPRHDIHRRTTPEDP